MRLRWIEARDFRNHEHTELEVPEGLVVAVGGNGEGKTNLLEAAFYLLALGSPRVSSDLPLVRGGTPGGSAYVRGEVDGLDGRSLIEVEVRGSGANRVQVNRSPVRRRRDVRRLVRSVFFSPGDLDVVQGQPDVRRSFLDEAISVLWPQHEPNLTAYDKALRQRNRLLKDWEGRGAPPGLAAWDAELVRTGAALTRDRAAAVAALGGRAAEEFEALTGYGLVVTYVPSVPPPATTGDDELDVAEQGSLEGVPSAPAPDPLERSFARRLAERREDELIRRTTLVGPHRDELELQVKDLTARAFASHGEAWAAALSLRLGLATAVAAEVGEPPVLLLDDPFPGLDPTRQRRLAARLSGRGQTIMSVADDAHVPEHADVVWQVLGGAVTVRGAA
ncbi:MAG TPA: DNA replication and repair protein RecF [Actinomycetota bacterium]|nr:DNA replication and repair protein RecF [Actinomycetota bacterium]